ncbi:RNA-directed DNA polymerase, eukaryota [Tanacetum coccineum]
MLNKLPTKVNLDRKGVDVGSILCPICSEDVESANHIFFSCEMAKDLWALFARWWELDIPVFDNFSEWVAWLNSSHLSNKAKLFLEGVGGLSYGPFGVFEIGRSSRFLPLRRRLYGILLFLNRFFGFHLEIRSISLVG